MMGASISGVDCMCRVKLYTLNPFIVFLIKETLYPVYGAIALFWVVHVEQQKYPAEI